MSNVARQIEREAWSVPDGWRPDRFGTCRECGERVLWAKVGSKHRDIYWWGTILRFNRDGSEHGKTCDGNRRKR